MSHSLLINCNWLDPYKIYNRLMVLLAQDAPACAKTTSDTLPGDPAPYLRKPPMGLQVLMLLAGAYPWPCKLAASGTYAARGSARA